MGDMSLLKFAVVVLRSDIQPLLETMRPSLNGYSSGWRSDTNS